MVGIDERHLFSIYSRQHTNGGILPAYAPLFCCSNMRVLSDIAWSTTAFYRKNIFALFNLLSFGKKLFFKNLGPLGYRLFLSIIYRKYSQNHTQIFYNLWSRTLVSLYQMYWFDSIINDACSFFLFPPFLSVICLAWQNNGYFVANVILLVMHTKCGWFWQRQAFCSLSTLTYQTFKYFLTKQIN